jgi:amidase
MPVADLCTKSLTEVAELIERRELSPVELTRAVLERIEQLDAQLHSYLTVTPERALAAARAAEDEIGRGARRGPLHGVPIGVKDLCATRGVRTTCASGVLADHVPDRDATVVRRLEAAGAIIVGKHNLTEFALMGYHPTLPIPRNPWDLSRDTGGSSSGAGVATAAGLCFAAIGTDTGGSIRMPSSWCGVVGLKPTYGRVSRAGVFALGASLDHVGPMARRVADAAVVLDAIAGFDPDDATTRRDPAAQCAAAIGADVRGVRIGWDERFVADGAQPEVVDAVRQAVRELEAQGAHLVEVELPPVDAALQSWTVLCAAEAAVAHAGTFPSRAADYGPTFRSFLEYAATLSARDYAAGHETRLLWNGGLRGVFERIDVLACPSSFMSAPPAAALDPYLVFSGAFVPFMAPFMRFTAPFNYSGSPTLSVPCGFDADGMPYSLQLVGRHGDEALLCRIGHAYEEATDWHRRRPRLG